MDAPALAAAIGGSVVGLAGVAFGWLNSLGERKNRLALTRDQHEHERSVARGARLFEARAVAYQELLKQLRQAMLVVERTHPIVGPMPDPPPAPSDEAWEEMYVRFAVLGSDELMAAFETFGSKVRGFHVYANTFDLIKAQDGPMGDTVEQMNSYRTQAGEALSVVERQMRQELAGL